MEEEERLIELRMTAEGNAKRLDAEVKQEIENAIERARAEGEAEAKKSFERTNSLCATPYGIDIVGITEGIALVGALVGGAKRRDFGVGCPSRVLPAPQPPSSSPGDNEQ